MSSASYRAPRTVEQATVLLERVALLDGEIATAEANREAAIAATNAIADTLVSPLLDERAKLVAVLEPWWAKAGAELTGGKRKTLVIGGCTIGTKAARAKLEYAGGDDKAALAALQECRWAKPYIRVSYAVDKVATTKGLTGKHAAGLAELGFSLSTPPETFVLERAGQDGTIAQAAA